MLAILTTLAALAVQSMDPETDENFIPKTPAQMQETLMRKFYAENADYINQISLWKPNSPVCGKDGQGGWQGIICKDNAVIHVSHPDQPTAFHGFCIRFLPNSVTLIDVQRNFINDTLDTRQLPLELTFLNITKNLYHGTCDLRKLPRRLEHLIASHNEFESVGAMDNLPPHIVGIFFTGNKMKHSVVFVGEIPPSLQAANFISSGVKRLKVLPWVDLDTSKVRITGASISQME